MGARPIPVGNDDDSLGAGRQAISRERGLAAQLREARLDLPVDVREALVVADERALHRVQRELLDVVEREAEHARETPELLRQRHVRHEPVVGVHGHAEPLLHELADRMLDGQSSSGMRLSRIYAASGPSFTTVSSTIAMSSMRRTPCPMRCAPQYWS